MAIHETSEIMSHMQITKYKSVHCLIHRLRVCFADAVGSGALDIKRGLGRWVCVDHKGRANSKGAQSHNKVVLRWYQGCCPDSAAKTGMIDWS